ncbi:hypothetical protein C7212DRAFT_360619 [Tuber magnatum]|uniref:Uncharacterized protein n=1 Tax=Tuber magnatum TaxID=42249 RepID=A0A317SXL3_9PEZI|nr:hypothetical protein C7212DRAFT_360619 [Tuber magnatum]
MMLHDNVSRAEVYAATAKHHRELAEAPTPPKSLDTPSSRTFASGRKRSHKAAELRSILERLLVAFHPNSVPLLPCAEWILSYYPPNPAFFRSSKTLSEDTRNSDADRVSRVIAHNSAQIDRLRRAFSEAMKQIQEERKIAGQLAIIADMEELGVEWGTSEARIQAVMAWFHGRWGGRSIVRGVRRLVYLQHAAVPPGTQRQVLKDVIEVDMRNGGLALLGKRTWVFIDSTWAVTRRYS